MELSILIIVLLIAVIWLYNTLVRDRNQVRAAWSDIDVQLKRRHDLVPALVSTVKAYAIHERATMAAVTELRSRSQSASHLTDKATVEMQIEQGLHRLVAVAEAYPDLKANEGFRQLQTQLTEIEDHLQYARRFYNGSVRILNTRIQSFPHLLLAGPLGFTSAEFFQVDNDRERDTPTIEVS